MKKILLILVVLASQTLSYAKRAAGSERLISQHPQQND